VAIYPPDPVGSGLVASIARPGGNVTGLSDVATTLSTKRLSLLKELLPQLRRVAMLLDVVWTGPARDFRAFGRSGRSHLQRH